MHIISFQHIDSTYRMNTYTFFFVFLNYWFWFVPRLEKFGSLISIWSLDAYKGRRKPMVSSLILLSKLSISLHGLCMNRLIEAGRGGGGGEEMRWCERVCVNVWQGMYSGTLWNRNQHLFNPFLPIILEHQSYLSKFIGDWILYNLLV